MITTDVLIDWHEDYGVGLDMIDEQHRRLFLLMNHLWEAILPFADASVETVTRLIQELESYARSHFAEEEEFMNSTGYPRLQSHQKAHEAFLNRIHAEKEALREGSRVSLDLLLFLRDWLISHVLVADRDYAGHAGYVGPGLAVLPEAA